MEALGEDPDVDSDSVENRLLRYQDSFCVCSKAWEKDFICGWAPSLEKRISRSKPVKTHASFGNARKERKVSLIECGFVFRHYEKSSRYIEQYRENHSSVLFEKETEWRPVLGVDIPDPYLPKISSSSSETFDRAKFIEAMCDYYKVAAMRSDLQNICLTGKTTENSDRKTTASSNTKKPSNQGLPFIVTSSYSKQISAKVEKKNSLDEGREEKTNPRDLIRTAPELTQDTVLPSVPSKPDAPHQTQDKPVSISAKSRSKDETKRFQKDRIRLPKFQWTESRVINSEKISKENSNVTDKMEKRETKTENISNSDSDERANRQLISRGNLHLGSTVQSPKLNSRLHSRVTVGKCEVFSSTAPNTVECVRKPYQTRTKFPSETSFIRILGHQTGPPPKVTSQNRSKEENKERPKTEEKVCPSHNLPLQYLTKFGGRNFHHVLEARSFKPGERKLRATALADFHS